MILRRQFLLIGLVIFLFLVLQSSLLSQSGRGKGRASGTVEDESGNPVVNTKVSLQFLGGLPQKAGGEMFKASDEIVFDTETSDKGKWSVGGLGSGRWQVIINAEGFMPYTETIYVSQFERNPYPDVFPRLPLISVLKKGEQQLQIEAPNIELFVKGNALFREQKYQEAIESYRAFLEENPDKHQVHFSIGECYRQMNDCDTAIQEYTIAVDNADPEKDKQVKSKSLTALAECYLKKDDMESAQEYFKQSLELSPEDEILAYNVGEIYFSNQKLDEAVEYFSQASRIKPEWPDAYLKLGYVYLNKADNANAIINFEKFLELESGTERAATVTNVLNYLKK